MRWPHRREDPFAGFAEELGEPATDVTEWLAGLAEQTALQDAEAAVEVLGVGWELTGEQTFVRLTTEDGTTGLGQSGCWGYPKGVAGVLEELTPLPGEIHHFDNRKPHWVQNDSGHDRMTLIVCIRTDRYG